MGADESHLMMFLAVLVNEVQNEQHMCVCVESRPLGGITDDHVHVHAYGRMTYCTCMYLRPHILLVTVYKVHSLSMISSDKLG